jgi:hypothetical protein
MSWAGKHKVARGGRRGQTGGRRPAPATCWATHGCSCRDLVLTGRALGACPFAGRAGKIVVHALGDLRVQCFLAVPAETDVTVGSCFFFLDRMCTSSIL